MTAITTTAAINYGQALAVLTGCGVKARDAKVGLMEARNRGLYVVLAKATGWTIVARGREFILEQERI